MNLKNLIVENENEKAVIISQRNSRLMKEIGNSRRSKLLREPRVLDGEVSIDVAFKNNSSQIGNQLEILSKSSIF